MRDVAITGDAIRLGQLLKVAGIVGSGGEAKALLSTGTVSVNDRPEERRGRQLTRGDVVRAGADEVRIT